MKRKSHSKPHLTKWVMIEMWPTIDPITNKQALMVHKGAITEIKQVCFEPALKLIITARILTTPPKI